MNTESPKLFSVCRLENMAWVTVRDGKLHHLPANYIGFENHPQATFISEGKAPVTRQWYYTVFGSWEQAGKHGNVRSGRCHCEYLDCPIVGLFSTEDESPYLQQDIAERVVWLEKLEIKRQKAREAARRRKERDHQND